MRSPARRIAGDAANTSIAGAASREWFPLVFALLAFGLGVWILWDRSMLLTHGRLTYGLDDAYIHMAIAKNLAHRGVWAVSAGGWSGASSSLLWTSLLGVLYCATGIHEATPFLLNILFAVGLLYVADLFFRKLDLRPLPRLGLLLLLFLAFPLASQPLIGMEVSLQCLLVVWFFYLVFWKPRPQDGWMLAMSAFFLGAVRYECILLAVLVSVGLWARGEARRPMLIAIATLLPALIYAALSVMYGGDIVPNTVLLKAGLIASALAALTHSWWMIPLLLVIITLLLLMIGHLFRRYPGLRPSREAILFLAVGVTLAVQLRISASEQQFERYLSYLYVSGVLSLGVAFALLSRLLRSHWPFRAVVLGQGLVVLALGALLLPKFLFYFDKTPIACKNITDQQVQVARFVSMYACRKPVVLADIGAVGFYSESPVIDVVGLGTNSVARAQLSKQDAPERILRIIQNRGSRLAVLYPVLHFQPGREWLRRGELIIDSDYVCARDTIGFYAIHPSDTTWLDASLRDYRRRCPSRIILP